MKSTKNESLSDCQLLIDPPAVGAWNMAVDEALLEATAESHRPTLRFYQWSRPTLSLGYFQSYAERDAHAQSKAADVVRRLSGGGAIVHDQELTYSLFLPASHPLSGDTQNLYNTVHLAIIEVLQSLITPDCAWQPVLGEPTTQLAAAEEPFLCFQRRARGDILLRKLLRNEVEPRSVTHKIVGSAQRRKQGATLQHGSLLLQRSTAAPQLDGIADLCDVQITPAKLLTQLPEKLCAALRLRPCEAQLADAEKDAAAQIMGSKYQAPTWTQRR